MHRLPVLSIVIFLVLISFSGFTQSISELRDKKSETTKEIEFTTRLLQENRKSERTSLNKINLLSNQIRKTNTLIATINNEISIYDACISNNLLSVKMLEDDLKDLKKEYAQMIRLAYKNQNSNHAILFLLSAESFNQAYRRLNYMRRYAENRENQVETIASVQDVLAESKIRLEKQKSTKQELINEAQREKKQLANLQGQQNNQLQELKSQKQDLQAKLRAQRKIEQQLENEIQRIIEEEARKNQAKGGSGFTLTPEQQLIGNNFEQNKKRIPWPLERGVIVERFGVHQHPVLPNVQVRNNGVSIATEIGAKARAVFNGDVSRVFGISGGNTAVIIRHGAFLSVYSNLKEVLVKAGEKVSTKQIIGTVFTDFDDDNKTILKFQIWRENQKLNPEEWIVK